MSTQPIVLAVGIALIAAAAFDSWHTMRRGGGRLRLRVALVHTFLWPVLIAGGVAAIEYATADDALTYSERLLRAASAFAGAASVPAATPEGLLLGLTRLAGRIYLVIAAFLLATVLLQHRNAEGRTS